MSDKATLYKAIVATYLACTGREPPADLLRIHQDALSGYSLDICLAALRRCYKEHKGHLAPSDVISRIDDGWPEPNEAWALCTADESTTVVVCDEILSAYNQASQNETDRQAVRMAFREIYAEIRREARERRSEPRWFVSLGTDNDRRQNAVREALQRGRLTEKQAENYLSLPAHSDDVKECKRLVGAVERAATREERDSILKQLPWCVNDKTANN
jgi:hypothetical protein